MMNNKRNLILIGMPGAGKSTVGVVLAKKLGCHFIDTDIVIQEKTGLVLEDIIKTEGIDGFIEMENEISSKVQAEKTVISTGGSMCHCDGAMKNFKRNGTVIYLKLPYETIAKRLGDFSDRGVALREGQTLKNLYDERIALYEKYADVTIDCVDKDVKTIVEEIKENHLPKDTEHRYVSKRYWKDQSTAMGQVDMMAKAYDDVISLSLGDPDLTTHQDIIDAAFKDASKGHTKYTDFRGDPELREEICKFYEEEYQMTVSDEETFICASACLGMYLVLEAILDDGDEVILQAPYFTPYSQQVTLARGVPVELPTFEEEDFQINVERLERLITDKTKALVINSPSNPTGNCLTVDTMKKIRDIAIKYDLIIIADDIYTSFSYQNKFIPFASLEGTRDRTIILNSFSKNFTMTGWRVGNIIAPSYIVKVIQQINENLVFTAPSISQRAALHALKHRDKIQPPMIEEYRKRMFYAADRISKIPKLKVINPPKGSFYLFVNIKETGLTSQEATELILKEAHVLTIPGNAFGSCGEGYIRLACTVGIETLAEAFDRIERIKF